MGAGKANATEPLPFQQLTHTLTSILTLSVMGSIAIVAVTLLLTTPNAPANEVAFYYVVVALSIAAMVLVLKVHRASMPSYAVVIPTSLKEYRESRASQMYPRRSWIVAIVAAILLAISVGVAVWAVMSR